MCRCRLQCSLTHVSHKHIANQQAIKLAKWAHRCEIRCKSLEVLRNSFIQVGQGGLHYLVLVVLLKLLRLLRFDATPVLQHMVLGDFLHAHSYLSGVQPCQDPKRSPA